MNGELAQLIALTAHGNSFLAGCDTAELFPGHSTFRFVNRVRFRQVFTETNDCRSWWQSLREDGITRLRLARVPHLRRTQWIEEHEAVAFAGGLSAAILTDSNGENRNLWRSRWEVSEPQHPARAIWAIEYAAMPPNASADSPALEAARRALAESLERIHAFARDQNLADWLPWFAEAIGLLSSSDPVLPFHPDLLPETGYPLPARQLLAATVRGWVFGGMGSWNDIGSTHPAYGPLTREYFQAVMNAIVTATNAFDPN
jgi:hypothetical protein